MKVQEIEFLRMEYRFSSGTGDLEADRYINKYEVEIWGEGENEQGEELSQLIGKASFCLFLIGLALDESFDMYQLFDEGEVNRELGNMAFNWDTEEFNEDFENIIGEVCNSNILYLDRIEILPEFKGRNFGKKVIKDIVCRFHSCCGVVVLKAFPLQFEYANISGMGDEWSKKMKYDELLQNEKMARKQLNQFYKSIGFTQYPKSEYFYLDPDKQNRKLEKIDLSEC